MKYFSTFTGIGGFEIGIHNAYRSAVGGIETDSTGIDEKGARLLTSSGQDISPSKRRVGERLANIFNKRSFRVGGESPAKIEQNRKGRNRTSGKKGSDVHSGSVAPLCVGFSEIDPYAVKVYEKHFKGAKNYGDITKIKADELPDFDCLVGGFPCQAFSISGKRHGFNDTRGTLFFDLARILRAKQPRLFVFENVKGLLSHDNGNTFKTIIAAIDELGYDCQWQIINSKNHGVPQNRERVIIVGHLRGTPRPQVFPFTDADIEALQEQPISTAIDANYWKGIDNHGQRTAIVQLNTPVHSTHRIFSPTGIGPTLGTMQGGGRQPYIALAGNEAIDSQEAHAARVRKASGVPRQLDVISDSQRYKMCGNAITTNVVQAVFERIFRGTDV